MFVVVIDRLRQRVMTAIRILFLLAVVGVLAAQLYGLFQTSLALRSGQGGASGPDRTLPGPSQRPSAGRLLDNLTRDLQNFYQGR